MPPEERSQPESPRVELRSVLDVLDAWIAQQSGLEDLSFSYEAEGGFHVTLTVSHRLHGKKAANG